MNSDSEYEDDYMEDSSNESYESGDYVDKFSSFFESGTEVVILSPNSYDEVGLPSFETMKTLMHPTERKGSVSRRIARVKIGNSLKFYLIKGVKENAYGENEVKIGKALNSLGILSCVGAVFGFVAKNNISLSDELLYYVVVPWMLGTFQLDYFIKNKKSQKYKLTTKQCIQLFYPIIQDLTQLWNDARFSHGDSKLDQVLFLSTSTPYRLLLVDFGLSSIDVKIGSEQIKVDMCQMSKTQDWLECLSNFINNGVHQFVTNDYTIRDKDLIKVWNKNRSKLSKMTMTPIAFLKWMQSV